MTDTSSAPLGVGPQVIGLRSAAQAGLPTSDPNISALGSGAQATGLRKAAQKLSGQRPKCTSGCSGDLTPDQTGRIVGTAGATAYGGVTAGATSGLAATGPWGMAGVGALTTGAGVYGYNKGYDFGSSPAGNAYINGIYHDPNLFAFPD